MVPQAALIGFSGLGIYRRLQATRILSASFRADNWTSALLDSRRGAKPVRSLYSRARSLGPAFFLQLTQRTFCPVGRFPDIARSWDFLADAVLQLIQRLLLGACDVTLVKLGV
jgi:hypothetical protein